MPCGHVGVTVCARGTVRAEATWPRRGMRAEGRDLKAEEQLSVDGVRKSIPGKGRGWTWSVWGLLMGLEKGHLG